MNKAKFIKALTLGKDASWYKMQVTDEVSDIFIYDEISWWGINADQFVKDLNSIKSKTIRLHLNSPGGNVFDGVAIHNALKQHSATVETYIEGLAASIASVIALAADKIYMAENAFFMIHEPWILTVGDSNELRKTADLLDKISGVLVNTYVKATGQDEEQVKKWLQDETWFTADEAKDAGFVHEITDEIDAQDKHDLSIYDRVPKQLLADKEQDKEEKPTRMIRESMRMRLELANI